MNGEFEAIECDSQSCSVLGWAPAVYVNETIELFPVPVYVYGVRCKFRGASQESDSKR